jgi:hypothetical protein
VEDWNPWWLQEGWEVHYTQERRQMDMKSELKNLNKILCNMIMLYCQYWKRSQDAIVGIAIRYRLNGLGIESQWGGVIFQSNQTNPRAHPATCAMGNQSFTGIKEADQQPSTSTGLQMGQPYTWTSPLCLPTNVMQWPSPLPPLKTKWSISRYIPCELSFCISDIMAPQLSFSALWF